MFGNVYISKVFFSASGRLLPYIKLLILWVHIQGYRLLKNINCNVFLGITSSASWVLLAHLLILISAQN